MNPVMTRAGVAAAAAVVAALLAGCGGTHQQGARPPTQVGYVTLAAQPVTLRAELTGRTTASLVSDVRPQVSGIIKARLFTEGAQVKAGQVLYQIDPAPYQAAYDAARADLASAEAAVLNTALKDQRYAELRQIEGVSKQDAHDAASTHTQAVAAVAQKKAALETARINLEYTQVRAPISGRIGISAVTPGALVTAGQDAALSTIRSLDPMYVDVTQSSAQLLELRRQLAAGGAKPGGTKVSLKLEDGSQYPLAGVLKFQEVAVDESTGSVTLRAEFPNPQDVLLPGMFVRAEVEEGVQPDGILAPQQGVTHNDRGQATALVVDAQGKVEQRTLEVGQTQGSAWRVIHGLSDGDRLIVEGSGKVRAGDKVTAVAVNPDAPVATTAAAQPAQAH